MISDGDCPLNMLLDCPWACSSPRWTNPTPLPFPNEEGGQAFHFYLLQLQGGKTKQNTKNQNNLLLFGKKGFFLLLLCITLRKAEINSDALEKSSKSTSGQLQDISQFDQLAVKRMILKLQSLGSTMRSFWISVKLAYTFAVVLS